MKKFKNYREESKTGWGVEIEENQNISSDQIKLGAILRIADATEAMAKNYIDLQRRVKYLESETDRLYKIRATQDRSIAALKGHNKRLRNQLKK